MLKTGVSEKVVRRIMAEEGLVAHVPKRRRYGSYEGETTPAPANLVDRDFTAERPNEKWLTDISEIKARDGKVYLSPMIDCFDGKIVAYTAGFSPNAELANRMLEKAASTVFRQVGVSCLVMYFFRVGAGAVLLDSSLIPSPPIMPQDRARVDDP